MTGETLTFIEPAELKSKMDSGGAVILVDVRSTDEFAAAHAAGARNVPVDGMPDGLEKISYARNILVVTTCGSSGRSEKAAEVMSDNGFTNIAVLRGGLAAWRKEGLPVEGLVLP